MYEFSGDGCLPLAYYENGKRVGEVRFKHFLETGPVGVFPGPNPQTIICVYQTDLTVGVFIVELNQRKPSAVPPPENMFKSGIVKSTNLGLRRCKKAEVDQLMSYIRSADAAALRKMTFPGLLFHIHPNKQYLLTAIENGSGLYDKFPVEGGDIPEVDPGI